VTVDTQTAYALALCADMVPVEMREATGRKLAEKLADNGNHMSTGFLGTRPLLPALSASGQHDLAAFLLQSHEFPSWGYEVDQGATSIWERWDSYTKEEAFGRHNAAMNSFSHYAFGAVCEWMFRTLAGIDSDGPGYSRIIIRPTPPAVGSNAMHKPIDWVRASYDSIQGTIRSDWKIEGDRFHLNVTIPANTTGTVFLPTEDASQITESGDALTNHPHVKLQRDGGGHAVLSVASGHYEFVAPNGVPKAAVALKTSKPKDKSINPDGIDITGATELVSWDFASAADAAKWTHNKSVDLVGRDGQAFLVAIGPDSQMATTLPSELTGRLVIALRAKPAKGATCQFFWASPVQGFNGSRQSQRPLSPTDQVNTYLFTITGDGPLKKIRFDPFATYNKRTKPAEMMIERIIIYRLDE
jgi:alpha-L-rhamnosidase